MADPRPGELHVRDPRLPRFLAVALDEPAIAAACASSPTRVWIAPGLEPDEIARPRGEGPVIDLRAVVGGESLGDVAQPHVWPTVSRGGWWVASYVLAHPHASDLIEGAAPRDLARLLLSVANAGIARAVFDVAYVSRCLLALLPDQPPGAASAVRHIVSAARRKQMGRALYRDVTYDPGAIGPLPLGHTRRGHYVLQDRGRDRVVLAHADQILSQQYLEQLASRPFWAAQYSWRGRLNATWAGEALMQECLKAGRYASGDRGRLRE